VSINGHQVLTHFDIYASAGGKNIANIQQFTEASNAKGQIVIQFTTVVNNSLVNGIEIRTTTVPKPSIAGVSPTSGPEGTLVKISGANFGTAPGTVALNGTTAPVTSWSPSIIVVTVPSEATSGKVVVKTGAVASNGVNFTVEPLQLPSPAQVLAAIENVNNYWIANNKPGNADWDQATYFTGDLAAYSATGESNYLTFAQTWATNNSYSLCGAACGEGPGGNTTTFANYQAAGQVYIRLYQLTNTASDLSGISESISGMVNSTVDNEWTWIDAINMSMPDFVELGSINNDTNYYTKMYALYSYAKYSLGLYDSKAGLWWENGKYVNTTDHWSRGNGWVFAAHAKVLSVLPKSDPHYAEYLSTFTTMAQALAACQQPGGYWNSDLTGTDLAGPESSGTSFFLYGFAWGLNNGVLDQNTYLPVTEKAWNFLANRAIQPSGLLGYVQPTVVSSVPPSATSTADFGVGAFLLAAPQMVLLTQ
jgi:rhamnogalacturonyl hydrolase YesR